MNCVDRCELEGFLQGRLDPERLTAVDRHVSECAECRAALASMPAGKAAVAQLGTQLLGVADCPDYEVLSAYADGSLGADRAMGVSTHANACELCARDIARIEQLRSHAAMRDTVTVRPGASRARARQAIPLWQRAVGAIAMAGVVVAVAVSLGRIGGTPTGPGTVAQRPSIETPSATGIQPGPTPESPANRPPANAPGETVAVSPGPTGTSNADTPLPTTPETRTLLKDGKYRVIERDGKMLLANADGSAATGALAGRTAASIDEKLRTGKLKPIVVAMNPIYVRDGGDYDPPATAPKPLAPMGKVVMSDRPTLSWAEVDLAESYRVVVHDEDGHVVFEGIAKGHTLTLSKSLPRGREYSWQVGARFNEDDSWANSRASGFRVLSSEDLASIDRVRLEMPGSHLALAVTYESCGLYENAAEEYRALRRANLGSDLAHKLAVKQ